MPVSTRLGYWSRSADVPRNAAGLMAALAVGLFCASCVGLHFGFYRELSSDTVTYQQYGEAILRGEVPYRDFAVEYPPAALPTFILPAVVTEDGSAYRRWFELLMVLCGAAMVALMAIVLTRVQAGPARLTAALVFAAVAPLAIGRIILTRYDLWPAALTVAALAAVLSGRVRLGSGVLGLGFAAKVYPALLLPLVCSFVWKRRGRREALVCATAFVVVAAACLVPFAAIAPRGAWHSLLEQGNRPLQIESFGSAVLLAAHHLFGLGIRMEESHGSQNLAGSLPDTIAAVQTVLQVAAVVAVWIWYARGEPTGERLVWASAAAVAAFVAFGKVLSPQFLIWLIPLVPLVRGRRGLAASALLASALVLTQTWFPFRYWPDLAVRFDELPSWTVLVRDLALVALFVTLIGSLRQPKRV